jgi:hypothetical protein
MAQVLHPAGQLVVTADNRARLTSFTDPRRVLGMTPAKRVYRMLRRPDPGAMSYLYTPRRIDRMLLEVGLHPVERRTVGFGPLSILGRTVLEGAAGSRLDNWLQAQADRGVPGVRWTGWHYVVRAART